MHRANGACFAAAAPGELCILCALLEELEELARDRGALLLERARVRRSELALVERVGELRDELERHRRLLARWPL